jgi:heme exporter protein B|tara:strand:+ start:68195 stop:68794 length:600 start_codon:yes stop_codon:yes gene_type:complete
VTIARLIRRGIQPAEALIPALFFIIVISLTAFSVGPDARLLARIGPGMLWVAALLASLLPVGTLIEQDVRNGTVDQLRIGGLSLEAIMAARILSHWLGFGPALLAAALLSMGLIGAPVSLLLILAVGSIGLAAVGVIAAALISGARGGAAIAGILALPLTLPILIFGSGNAVRLVAAASLFLTALAPFAAAAALRIRER